MSVVDFREAAARPLLGALVHGELDGLLEPLSQLERRDVRDMLDLVTLRLAARAEGVRHFRSRLDAVIASLIGVVGALNGDKEQTEIALREISNTSMLEYENRGAK